MTAIIWDKAGDRIFETGVDHGVLYKQNTQGVYVLGVPWNGLISVTESPSGAEATPQYADNIKYLNLVSAEMFGATIEAFSYPREFEEHDGLVQIVPGVTIGQQDRKPFGLGYCTKVGNDVVGQDYAYKLHLIYGALAAPTEKGYTTVNDTPEAITFSWELTTTAVDVPGFKPTASLTIDSRNFTTAQMKALEDVLFGTAGVDPRLPFPAEIASIMSGATVVVASVDAPTYNATTKVITIPTVTGVEYQIDGVKKTGTVTITKDTVVTAVPTAGYRFPAVTDDDWLYKFA